MITNPRESAFPSTPKSARHDDLSWPDTALIGGLTKREYFSIRILQAFLSHPETSLAMRQVAKAEGISLEQCACQGAVEMADALVKELNGVNE